MPLAVKPLMLASAVADQLNVLPLTVGVNITVAVTESLQTGGAAGRITLGEGLTVIA